MKIKNMLIVVTVISAVGLMIWSLYDLVVIKVPLPNGYHLNIRRYGAHHFVYNPEGHRLVLGSVTHFTIYGDHVYGILHGKGKGDYFAIDTVRRVEKNFQSRDDMNQYLQKMKWPAHDLRDDVTVWDFETDLPHYMNWVASRTGIFQLVEHKFGQDLGHSVKSK